MTYYIDEAEVERAHAEQAAKHAQHRNENSSIGSQARVSEAVLRAYHLAMVREHNRGAMPAHMVDALAALMANMVLSYVGGLRGVVDGGDPVPYIANVTDRYMEFVVQALPQLREATRVPARPCGKA